MTDSIMQRKLRNRKGEENLGRWEKEPFQIGGSIPGGKAFKEESVYR